MSVSVKLDNLFTPKTVIIALIVYYIVTNYSDMLPFVCQMKSKKKESFVTDYSSYGTVGEPEDDDEEEEEDEEEEDNMGKIFKDSKIDMSTGCDQNKIPFLSSNLLPKEDPKLQDDFSEFAPKASDISGANFLDSDRFTMSSQTTRNANMGLRSEPPNPRNIVTPWMMSTIEPDTTRKPLEIGAQD